MNRIVQIIMKRDNISQEEAEELFTVAKEEAQSAVDGGDIFAVEAILSDHFGLEPDYVFDLIDL
jgi:hypothetical protein